ncbi:hypothetical protein [Croceicoccus sp. YJ47]|uniref:hypothetical protein n=1 Tax=Croceicoccus sp. YJ47 TaxID=2798724 RepID=UPI0019248184|nr:hypothetical protein [Croceicoccus sp. YJ47]QQN74412.1 hypothetical protein JD971_01015 [Croceicoccus sp. YJ47]
MAKLVQHLDAVVAAIIHLNEAVVENALLADRLAQAHAFYVYEREPEKPIFGFSKFVGYENLTPAKYLAKYKKLDGRNTEIVLSKWFEEVTEGSPTYEDLYEKLSAWLAQFGKRPRGGEKQKVRIMVIRPEFRDANSTKDEDRRLLDLLIAVADKLPATQRHELRAAL